MHKHMLTCLRKDVNYRRRERERGEDREKEKEGEREGEIEKEREDLRVEKFTDFFLKPVPKTCPRLLAHTQCPFFPLAHTQTQTQTHTDAHTDTHTNYLSKIYLA